MMSQLTSMANCDEISFAYGCVARHRKIWTDIFAVQKYKKIPVVVAFSMSLFLMKPNFRTQM